MIDFETADAIQYAKIYNEYKFAAEDTILQEHAQLSKQLESFTPPYSRLVRISLVALEHALDFVVNRNVAQTVKIAEPQLK